MGNEESKMRKEMMNRMAGAIKKNFGAKCKVQFQDVEKNNGLVVKAVTISEPGMTVSPMVYIDEVLDRLTSGDIDIRKAAQDIVDIYRNCRKKGDFGEIVSGLSGQGILEGVAYQIINAEKNERRLAGMPHKKFLDLAAVYRVTVGEDEVGTASFLVSSGLMGHYGLDEEDLDTAARRNTERQGFQVESMESILAKIIGEPEDEIKAGCPIWVLTNTKKIYGAAVMLYPEIFKNLADGIKSDMYVLPSSIHEIIAIPDIGAEPEELKLMVADVNSREVSEDEFLSGNVYKYIRRENRLVIEGCVNS